MLKEGAVIEVPVTGSTSVNDVVELFNHNKVYEVKHPTIQLEIAEEKLEVFALMLLYSALTWFEKEGKIKSRQNQKNIFISHGSSSVEDIEDMIEGIYNLSLVIIESPKAAKPTIKKHIPVKHLKALPVTEKTKLSLDDVFGIWKGKNVSLDKIREKAWGKRR